MTCDVCSAATARTSCLSTRSSHCDDCWCTILTLGGALRPTAGMCHMRSFQGPETEMHQIESSPFPRLLLSFPSLHFVLLHFFSLFSFPLSLCFLFFYARKQLLLSARLSHRNSLRPSVRLSVTRVDQSKTVQARITKSSPSAAWKTLVSGTVKLFHKFERGYP